MEYEEGTGLKTAYENIARLKEINAELMRLKKDEKALKVRLSEYDARLSKDNINDMNGGEGSISRMIERFADSVKKDVLAEYEDAEEAALKRLELQNDLNKLEARISALGLEKEAIADCETKYREIYEYQKQRLFQYTPGEAFKLLGLTEEINRSLTNTIEILKAMVPGQSALGLITSVIGNLEYAKDWAESTKVYTTIEYIEEAVKEAGCAQEMLNSFRVELMGLNYLQEEDGQAGAFTELALEDMESGFFVHKRIEKSIDNAKVVRDEVDGQLKQLKINYNSEIKNAAEKQSEIIELMTNV